MKSALGRALALALLLAVTTAAAELSPTQVDAYVCTIETCSDQAERLIAVRALRDGGIPSSRVEPLLTGLVAAGSGPSGEDALLRRLALEAIGRMRGAVSRKTVTLLVATACDPGESSEVSAQAAITVAAVTPKDSRAAVAAALAPILQREQTSPQLFQHVAATLGEFAFESRGILPDLLSALERADLAPAQAEVAGGAFARIALAIAECSELMGGVEVIGSDEKFSRAIVALKRVGTRRAIGLALEIRDALAGLRQEQQRRPWIMPLRYAYVYLGLTALILMITAMVWLSCLAILRVFCPHTLTALRDVLEEIDFAQLPKVGPLIAAVGLPPRRIGAVLSRLILIDAFAKRARVRPKLKIESVPPGLLPPPSTPA